MVAAISWRLLCVQFKIIVWQLTIPCESDEFLCTDRDTSVLKLRTHCSSAKGGNVEGVKSSEFCKMRAFNLPLFFTTSHDGADFSTCWWGALPSPRQPSAKQWLWCMVDNGLENPNSIDEKRAEVMQPSMQVPKKQ